MVQTIYLHNYIVDILQCFGDLDIVVNKILEAGEQGVFDLESCPKAPDRNHCKQYDIDITNESYLQLLAMRGNSSSTLSLRRIIYYFVDNEMYTQLDWQQTTIFIPQSHILFKKQLSRLLTCYNRLLQVTPAIYKNAIKEQIKKLSEISYEVSHT